MNTVPVVEAIHEDLITWYTVPPVQPDRYKGNGLTVGVVVSDIVGVTGGVLGGVGVGVCEAGTPDGVGLGVINSLEHTISIASRKLPPF
jgi:hypothetical protein